MRQCPRCEARLAGRERFCTTCGLDLSATAVADEPSEPPIRTLPRLVACPACGATNAGSRRSCGRCGDDLGQDGDRTARVVLPSGREPEHEPEGDDSDLPGLFLIVVVLAGLVLFGVLLAILTARDIGPFAGRAETDAAGTGSGAVVLAARTSSVLPDSAGASYRADNLVDGDETTAWSAAAPGDGVGQWLEFDVRSDTALDRLLVWNGHQDGDSFRERARAASLSIEVGGRTFTVELRDIDGPQAVNLPETVVGDRVRLTVLDVYPGESGDPVALSEVELLGPPGS